MNTWYKDLESFQALPEEAKKELMSVVQQIRRIKTALEKKHEPAEYHRLIEQERKLHKNLYDLEKSKYPQLIEEAKTKAKAKFFKTKIKDF
jgi:predicted Rossmann fold nucleotide-binding protein DprA/Smf involved in DNA uptake